MARLAALLQGSVLLNWIWLSLFSFPEIIWKLFSYWTNLVMGSFRWNILYIHIHVFEGTWLFDAYIWLLIDSCEQKIKLPSVKWRSLMKTVCLIVKPQVTGVVIWNFNKNHFYSVAKLFGGKASGTGLLCLLNWNTNNWLNLARTL